MDNSEDIHEYKIGGYHPVKLGDLFYERYQILQKIGFGHFSTVWLCLDIKGNEYVALKIQKSAINYTDAAMDEIDILTKIHKNYAHPKWQFGDKTHIVKILNHFMHKGPNGNHICLIFELLGANMIHLMKYYEFKGIPLEICKNIIKQCLYGIDYLHRICGVIHTDIKPENVLIILKDYQLQELNSKGKIFEYLPIIKEIFIIEELIVSNNLLCNGNDDRENFMCGHINNRRKI